MYGQLNISMVVGLGSPTMRKKSVRLASYHCERKDCDAKLAMFAEDNPRLWSAVRANITAEWVARDYVQTYPAKLGHITPA